MKENMLDTGGELSTFVEEAKEKARKETRAWLDEMNEKRIVEGKKNLPVVVAPAVPVADQLIFWNYLNDVQYGIFNPEAMTKQNTWLTTHKGTWLIQKNNSGYYGVRKTGMGIITLPKVDYPDAFFELAFGKIPNAILEQIIAFFREIMKRHNDAEAFIQVYWDRTESKYIINVPKQRIAKASVHYDALENLSNKDRSRYVFVYECHSHNSMGAFWSGTDNADEKELRIYGVFGQLNKDPYACKHRFFVGEEQVDLPIDRVFQLESEVEKQYAITHNSKQYFVPASKLILDEKPKYIYVDEQGNKQYIPVESVVLHRTKVEFPEEWFTSINVPLPPIVRPNHYKPESAFTKPEFGKSNNKGNAKSYNQQQSLYQSNLEKDPFYYNEDGEVVELEDFARTMSDTADEIATSVYDLLLLTADFTDMTTTLMFMEELEATNALYDLHHKISEYIGEYPVESRNALA